MCSKFHAVGGSLKYFAVVVHLAFFLCPAGGAHGDLTRSGRFAADNDRLVSSKQSAGAMIMKRLLPNTLLQPYGAVISTIEAGVVNPASVSGVTTRVSVDNLGQFGNFDSERASISNDGRYVAFQSMASNLVPGDTNIRMDIFVHDRQTAVTTRVSVANNGAEGNGHSALPSISGDGRYVAFQSDANNLVPGDTNVRTDVFVRDRIGGTTIRVSVASDGTQGNGASNSPAISADGHYVTFTSHSDNLVLCDTNNAQDVFLHDRLSAVTTRVSVGTGGDEADNSSSLPAINANGRYVVFASRATNLVPGDTNGVQDIFVRDTTMATTSRVSVATSGTQANGQSSLPTISADGVFVAFASAADNLVTGDTNTHQDIFVRNRLSGETTRVNVASGGVQANKVSDKPAISADGRHIAFVSYANNLVPDDTNEIEDIFVHDRVRGETTRASLAHDGSQANDVSSNPAISADGRFVAFDSRDDGLVPGALWSMYQIYVHDCAAMIPSPPVVVEYYPRGEDVRRGVPIVLNFDQGMNRTSVENNLVIDPAKTGTFTWSNGNRTVVFRPNAPFVANRLHRVTLTRSARSLAGVQMGVAHAWTFRTGGLIEPEKPQVVSHSPVGEGVLRSAPVVITFDQPMTRFSVENHLTVDPPKEGTFSWSSDSRTVTFRPNAPFVANRLHRVTLARFARSLSGEQMGAAHIWSFRTGGLIHPGPPVVTDHSPRGENVLRSAPIVITFDQGMNRASVQNNLVIDPPKEGTFTWSDAGRTVTFRPNAPFVANRLHRVTLTRSARSLLGVQMGTAYTWTFRTGAQINPASLAMTAAAAPARDGTVQVVVNLSAPARVRVQILNIAGRTVGLIPEQDLADGVNTLLWNGRSLTGTAAPPGQYLLTVEAFTETGERISCIAPLQR